MGLVFSSLNESSVVRLSTLVDRLDSAVRTQSEIEENQHRVMLDLVKFYSKEQFYSKDKQGQKIRKVNRKVCAIGVHLVHFLLERELKTLSTDVNFKEKVLHNKKGYYPNNCYAMCNLNFNLLPMKLNLPMICRPEPWIKHPKDRIITKKDDFITLSDITGGYLCGHTAEMFNRFKILTSRNTKNFNILLFVNKFKEMCQIMNGLQSQPFEVNRTLLKFIKTYRNSLEEAGLLMPLAHVNMTTASLQLRESYFKDEGGLKNVS